MAEPALSACADIVRRFDPHLFATALFAAEPARERLMTLYAFDIELSRAAGTVASSDTGPLIAAMRVQWWRDLVAEAGDGAEPRAHEVAAPLAALIAEGALTRADLDALIDARDREIDGEPDRAGFISWADARFGALTRLAAMLLSGTAPKAAHPAGQALGHAFALRTATPMAREGRCLLPDLPAGATSALARNKASGALIAALAEQAQEGLSALKAARATGAPRAAVPAFLPLWRAERTLVAVASRPEDVLCGLPQVSPARRAAALGWRALTGRW